MFPAPLSIQTAYAYVFGAALMGIAGVFSVDNLCSWALAWDINLVTILYNVCYFDQPDFCMNFTNWFWCSKFRKLGLSEKLIFLP
jgi:hypothetical protein